jgi:hypothetical protein
MAKTQKRPEQTGDDADVRGEHDFTPARKGTAEATVEEQLRRRKAGHYAAGADGTQDVRPEQKKSRRPPH